MCGSVWRTVKLITAVWFVTAEGVTMHRREGSGSRGSRWQECEVCGADGEVERAFGADTFDACDASDAADAPPPKTRRCPPGFLACVTKSQAHGMGAESENGEGRVVSKSCAEVAVAGCHTLNHYTYCYCKGPWCNARRPERRQENVTSPVPVPVPTHGRRDQDDDEPDDQEGSADDRPPPNNIIPQSQPQPADASSVANSHSQRTFFCSLIMPLVTFVVVR